MLPNPKGTPHQFNKGWNKYFFIIYTYLLTEPLLLSLAEIYELSSLVKLSGGVGLVGVFPPECPPVDAV